MTDDPRKALEVIEAYGILAKTPAQVDDLHGAVATLRAALDRLDEVCRRVQLRQPGGSAPPGDLTVLTEWVLATLERRAEAAEARVESQKALLAAMEAKVRSLMDLPGPRVSQGRPNDADGSGR